MEESIVVGTWRTYPYNDIHWVVEPVFFMSGDEERQYKSAQSAKRQRSFHPTLEEALGKILSKRIGDGARLIVQDWLLVIQQARDDIRKAVMEHAEYLRLKGLRLTNGDDD